MSDGVELVEAGSLWQIGRNVSLSGDDSALIWRRPYTAPLRSKGFDEIELFADFCNLALDRSTPQEVLQFAQRFGPLHLCEHGRPKTHIDIRDSRFFPEDLLLSHSIEHSFRRLTIVEEVAAWRALARQASAMVQIGESLHRGQSADASLWAELRSVLPEMMTVAGVPLMEANQAIDIQRGAHTFAVQSWLNWSDVGLTFQWRQDGSRPVGRVGASTLFGALALGLVLTVARAPDLPICAGCGKQFTAKRDRSRFARAWCHSVECEKARKKREARERRARRKALAASSNESRGPASSDR